MDKLKGRSDLTRSVCIYCIACVINDYPDYEGLFKVLIFWIYRSTSIYSIDRGVVGS